MDKELARNFEKSMGDAYGLLCYATSLAREFMPEDQLKAFKKEVGLFIGRTDDNYMSPIYKEYPDLMPEALRK